MLARLLQAIVRGFHCRNTHHCLAWDALPLVKTDPGKRLVRLLRRHNVRYLTGATDPDTRFCDFQNHVIHVRDGYWGGAPRVAHAWYERLQRYLRSDRYADAAHAAGVLNHYFTDALHPLHTHHDEREKVLHGPIEWSIHCGYRSILRNWKQSGMQAVFQLSDGPSWLGEAILHSARYAHRSYETLLDGYDAEKTLDDPSDALSSESRVAMSELFGLAITGWARVLERAAAEAEAVRGGRLPSFQVAFPAFFAAVEIPTAYCGAWLEDRHQRVEMAQLLEEWLTTYNVIEHLPTEVDIVHRVVRVREEERRWKNQRKERLESSKTAVGTEPRATIPFPAKRSLRRAA